MKILVIAGRFGISGVPLAQLRFARALAAKGHDVELAYGMINDGQSPLMAPDVRIRSFEKPRVSQLLLPLRRYFLTERPDIVFSAGDHLNVIVLLAAIASGSKAKISCSSRVTPYDTYSGALFSKGWALKQMSRFTMWRADALTCVAQDMVNQYREIFRNSRHVCVYNIVDDDESRERLCAPVAEPWLVKKEKPVIVAAGSLVPWKGFAELIIAISKVRRSRDVRLMILGEGELRAELEELINTLDLTECVKLCGNVENPLRYFSRADVFALSSHVEGMPNVLVEAMLCGCTPVSTNCPTGPRELLQDGRYGYLVPMRDPSGLAEGLLRALDRPIAKDVLQGAVQAFTAGEVIARHFSLLGVQTACPSQPLSSYS